MSSPQPRYVDPYHHHHGRQHHHHAGGPARSPPLTPPLTPAQPPSAAALAAIGVDIEDHVETILRAIVETSGTLRGTYSHVNDDEAGANEDDELLAAAAVLGEQPVPGVDLLDTLNTWLTSERRDKVVQQHIGPFFLLAYRGLCQRPTAELESGVVRVRVPPDSNHLRHAFEQYKTVFKHGATVAFWGFPLFFAQQSQESQHVKSSAARAPSTAAAGATATTDPDMAAADGDVENGSETRLSPVVELSTGGRPPQQHLPTSAASLGTSPGRNHNHDDATTAAAAASVGDLLSSTGDDVNHSFGRTNTSAAVTPQRRRERAGSGKQTHHHRAGGHDAPPPYEASASSAPRRRHSTTTAPPAAAASTGTSPAASASPSPPPARFSQRLPSSNPPAHPSSGAHQNTDPDNLFSDSPTGSSDVAFPAHYLDFVCARVRGVDAFEPGTVKVGRRGAAVLALAPTTFRVVGVEKTESSVVTVHLEQEPHGPVAYVVPAPAAALQLTAAGAPSPFATPGRGGGGGIRSAAGSVPSSPQPERTQATTYPLAASPAAGSAAVTGLSPVGNIAAGGVSPSGAGVVAAVGAREVDPELCAAAKHGDVSTLRRLLLEERTSAYVSANAIDDDSGATVLHHAVTANNLDAVTLLLDSGAEINGLACAAGPPLARCTSVEMAELLMSRGASLAATTGPQGSRGPALHAVAEEVSAAVLATILQLGAAAAATSIRDPALTATALRLSASDGGGAEAESTPERRAPPTLDFGALREIAATYDENGRTALHRVARAGRADAAGILIDVLGVNVNAPDGQKRQLTPLHEAAHYGRVDVATVLLDRGADVNSAASNSIPPIARVTDSPAMATLLLDRGANPVMGTGPDCDVPAVVSLCELTRLTEATLAAVLRHPAVQPHLDTLKSCENGCQQNALHRAAAHGSCGAVKALVAAGFDVNEPEKRASAYGALHLAAQHGKYDTVAFLLDSGADINATSSKGITPFCRVTDSPSVATLLLDRGADPFARVGPNGDVVAIASLCELPKLTRDTLAAILRHPKTQEQIQKLSEPNGGTMAAIHRACTWGSVGAVEALLDAGVDPNLPDATADEYRPLHRAANAGNLEIVRLLLDRGADVDGVSAKNVTPLCRVTESPEVATLLLDRGADPFITVGRPRDPHAIASLCELPTLTEATLRAVLRHESVRSRHNELRSTDNNGLAAIHRAATWGSAGALNALLDVGINANTPDGTLDRFTPLHRAVHRDRLDNVKLLLRRGADPNALSSKSIPPISRVTSNPEVAKVLLDHGADPFLLVGSNRNVPALSSLCELDSLAAEAFASILDHPSVSTRLPEVLNAVDGIGCSIIHRAASWGSAEAVAVLLDRGAAVNMVDNTADQFMPLHRAVHGGKVDTVKLLLERGAEVNGLSAKGIPPLSRVVNSAEIATLLLDHGADPFIMVGPKRNVGAIWSLCELRSLTAETLNAILGHRSVTPRMPLVLQEHDGNGYTMAHRAAAWGSVDALRVLLDHGTPVDARDASVERFTLLHRAALHGNVKTTQLLLDRGALIDALSARNTTPLSRVSKPPELARLLLDRGADPFLRGWTNWSVPVLHMMADLSGMTAETIAAVLSHPRIRDNRESLFESYDGNGNTVLHRACMFGSEATVAAMLDHGADIEGRGRSAEAFTPLHAAARFGKVENVRLLLRRGADVEARTHDLNLPPIALARGHPEIVRLLLDHNADVTATRCGADRDQSAVQFMVSCPDTSPEVLGMFHNTNKLNR